MAQHGQHEGERLAGACLGDANAVPAAHDGRQRLRLNWHGLGVLHLAQHLQRSGLQPALRPGLHRLRVVLAPHLQIASKSLIGTASGCVDLSRIAFAFA